jgi:hypothetical protein
MTTTGDPFDPRKNTGLNPKIPGQNIGKNLMSPGSGTSWEDRGSIGLPAAYLKTVFSMLFSPIRTVDKIKRVDYRKDALTFVIVSAVPWFLTVWIHTLILYRFVLQSLGKNASIDNGSFFTRAFFGSVIVGGGTVLLFTIAAKIYFGMVRGQDMKGRGTPDLIYNVCAYCFSPSILAMIPFIGPPAAIIWGLWLSIIIGINRLRVKPGGAATAACFSLIAGLAIVIGALALGWFLWPSPYFHPDS